MSILNIIDNKVNQVIYDYSDLIGNKSQSDKEGTAFMLFASQTMFKYFRGRGVYPKTCSLIFQVDRPCLNA